MARFFKMLFSDLWKRLKNNLIILLEAIIIVSIMFGGIVIPSGYIGKFILGLFVKNVNWFLGIKFILLIIMFILLICWIISEIKQLIYYIKDVWNKSKNN